MDSTDRRVVNCESYKIARLKYFQSANGPLLNRPDEDVEQYQPNLDYKKEKGLKSRVWTGFRQTRFLSERFSAGLKLAHVAASARSEGWRAFAEANN